MPTTTTRWTQDDIARLNARFAQQSPRAVLKWTFETFGDEAVMGTGFGASGIALMDILADVHPGATVFYLDTDLFFSETYALRDRLTTHFDLNIVRVHSGISLEEQAQKYGPELWERDPNQCCFIRKIKPLRAYLADKDAWITAIRRDQTTTRAGAQFVEWSATNGVVKVNPLAAWTEETVWSYLHANDLPYNPLHDEGYPSIGCIPCTAPVNGNASDPRAGRWSGHAKTECGLHLEPQPT